MLSLMTVSALVENIKELDSFKHVKYLNLKFTFEYEQHLQHENEQHHSKKCSQKTKISLLTKLFAKN